MVMVGQMRLYERSRSPAVREAYAKLIPFLLRRVQKHSTRQSPVGVRWIEDLKLQSHSGVALKKVEKRMFPHVDGNGNSFSRPNSEHFIANRACFNGFKLAPATPAPVFGRHPDGHDLHGIHRVIRHHQAKCSRIYIDFGDQAGQLPPCLLFVGPSQGEKGQHGEHEGAQAGESLAVAVQEVKQRGKFLGEALHGQILVRRKETYPRFLASELDRILRKGLRGREG